MATVAEYEARYRAKYGKAPSTKDGAALIERAYIDKYGKKPQGADAEAIRKRAHSQFAQPAAKAPKPTDMLIGAGGVVARQANAQMVKTKPAPKPAPKRKATILDAAKGALTGAVPDLPQRLRAVPGTLKEQTKGLNRVTLQPGMKQMGSGIVLGSPGASPAAFAAAHGRPDVMKSAQKGFTDPEGVAASERIVANTLPLFALGGAPAVVQKAAGLGFGALSGKNLYERATGELPGFWEDPAMTAMDVMGVALAPAMGKSLMGDVARFRAGRAPVPPPPVAPRLPVEPPAYRPRTTAPYEPYRPSLPNVEPQRPPLTRPLDHATLIAREAERAAAAERLRLERETVIPESYQRGEVGFQKFKEQGRTGRELPRKTRTLKAQEPPVVQATVEQAVPVEGKGSPTVATSNPPVQAREPATPESRTLTTPDNSTTPEGIVAYHGTDAEFDTFDLNHSKQMGKFGHWFTPDEDFAGLFGKNVKKAELGIRNPKVITESQWNAIREAHAKDAKWFNDWRERLISEGYDGLHIKGEGTKLGKYEIEPKDVYAVFRDDQVRVIALEPAPAPVEPTPAAPPPTEAAAPVAPQVEAPAAGKQGATVQPPAPEPGPVDTPLSTVEQTAQKAVNKAKAAQNRKPREFVPPSLTIDENTHPGAAVASQVVRRPWTADDGSFHPVGRHGRAMPNRAPGVSLGDLTPDERTAFMAFMREYGTGGERNYMPRREVLMKGAGGKPTIVNGSEVESFDVSIPRREVVDAIENYKSRTRTVADEEAAYYKALEDEYRAAPDRKVIDETLEEYDFGDPLADDPEVIALLSNREAPYGSQSEQTVARPAGAETGPVDPSPTGNRADTGVGRLLDLGKEDAGVPAKQGQAGLAPDPIRDSALYRQILSRARENGSVSLNDMDRWPGGRPPKAQETIAALVEDGALSRPRPDGSLTFAGEPVRKVSADVLGEQQTGDMFAPETPAPAPVKPPMGNKPRTLRDEDAVGHIMGLTQADYDAAKPFIPDSVLRGSGEENGYVFGIKHALAGNSDVPDPQMGGSIYGSAIKGFNLARESAPKPLPKKGAPVKGKAKQRGMLIVPDLPDWRPRWDKVQRAWVDPDGVPMSREMLSAFRAAGWGAPLEANKPRVEATTVAEAPKTNGKVATVKGPPVKAPVAPPPPKNPVEPKTAPKAATPKADADAIGIKNAALDAQRVRQGLEVLEPSERRTWDEAYSTAVRDGLKDKAEEIVARGDGLSDAEAAGVAIRMTEIDNAVNAARASGDTAKRNTLLTQYIQFTDALKRTKAEMGRGLNALKMAIDPEEFTLAKLVQKSSETRKRPLTNEEINAYDELVKAHEATLKEVERLTAENAESVKKVTALEEAQAKKAIQKETITRKAAGTVEGIRKKRQSDIDRFMKVTGQANAGLDPEAAYLLGKIAMSYVSEGAVTLDAVVQRTLVDVKGVTKEDVVRALSEKNPSKASAERMKRLRLQKTIREEARLTAEIEDGMNGLFAEPGPSAPRSQASENVKRLRTALAQVKAEAGRPAPKDVTAAARRAKALSEREARIQKELADAQRGIFKTKGAGKPRTEPANIQAMLTAIKELKRKVYLSGKTARDIERQVDILDSLKARLEGRSGLMKQKGTKPAANVDPELAKAKAEVAELRRLVNATERGRDLQRQLDTGDFTPKRVLKADPPALMDAKIKNKRLEMHIREKVKSGEKMTVGKAITELRDVTNDLTATADISATGRQGFIPLTDLAFRDPKTFMKIAKDSLEAFGSEEAAVRHALEIEANPAFPRLQRAGLVYNEPGLHTNGDYFRGSLAEKHLPTAAGGGMVRGSSRHMTHVLNAGRYEQGFRFLEKYPNATDKELKDFCSWQNIASGIGDWGEYGNVNKAGRWVFRAPGWMLSRWQTITRLARNDYSPRVRAEMAKEMVAPVSLGMGTLALAALAGYKTTLDPNDPDFGKVVVGNHHVDFWFGLQPEARIIAQIGKLAADRVRGKENKTDPADIGFKYLKYRLNALNGTLYTLLSGKNVIGQKQTPAQAVGKGATPIIAQSVYEAWKEGSAGLPGGADDAVGVGALEALGFGVSTYDKKKEENKSSKVPAWAQ